MVRSGGCAMTEAENPYRHDVFLEELRDCGNRDEQRIWSEHQQMQLSFLQRHGLQPSSIVLDLGCGPMRLGSALIPLLRDGWYFGQDLNPSTIAFGEEVLREVGITESAPYTLFASDQFNLDVVDKPVQIAFANSLFSHLTLNSILTALLQILQVLAPQGVLYATFFALEPKHRWLSAHPRNKWGREFSTFPHQDPYHYPLSLLRAVARQAGFHLDVMHDFGHPTQTMGRFRRRRLHRPRF
jgi:SAM-dependent methyltransferase